MDRNLAEVKQVAQKVNFRNGVTESLKFVSISYSIQMETQPTEVTCGPTCLSGMYRFLGSPVSIDDIIQQVTFVKGGGTLEVHLGLDALKREFDVQICNLIQRKNI